MAFSLKSVVGDDDRVDTAVDQTLRAVGGLRSDLLGDCFGDGGKNVGDDEGIDSGQRGQGIGVKCADPAEPDQAETHDALLLEKCCAVG